MATDDLVKPNMLMALVRMPIGDPKAGGAITSPARLHSPLWQPAFRRPHSLIPSPLDQPQSIDDEPQMPVHTDDNETTKPKDAKRINHITRDYDMSVIFRFRTDTMQSKDSASKVAID